MLQEMKLWHDSFVKILEGSKTIEMRLLDEKRSLLQPGDTIRFTDAETGDTLEKTVVALHKYPDFDALYQRHSKISIGYGANEPAAPEDMLQYYSAGDIARYGVVGIQLADSYQDINARTIDRWVSEGWEWGVPITPQCYAAAKKGVWDVLLTPTKPVPHHWFGDLKGKKLLGLASGGGQQMPIFTALGAVCTVLDYSQKQLESEKAVAAREGYDIQIIRADMTKPLPFPDESFDIIFHPVSNCYVEKVEPIFRECYRILKPGGILLSGLGNEVNYIVNEDETAIENEMPFNPLTCPRYRQQLEQDDCGMQFSHTIQEQLGGQLQAGFILKDIYGDTNGEGRLHEMGIESYYATWAVKPL